LVKNYLEKLVIVTGCHYCAQYLYQFYNLSRGSQALDLAPSISCRGKSDRSNCWEGITSRVFEYS